MKKLSNTESELKKSVAYEKSVYFIRFNIFITSYFLFHSFPRYAANNFLEKLEAVVDRCYSKQVFFIIW